MGTTMSSAQEEVLSIRQQLEKMTKDGEQGQALDLLQRLGEIDMNLGILTNTRIGMTVNALRKSSSDDEVISHSKGLIKAWKKFVPDNNSEKKEKSEKTFDQKKATATGDEIRLSCRRLLATALRGEGDLPEGTAKTPEELAELVEETIFNNHKSTNPKYKNAVRSRVFNLKDKKNPELRENVLCGVISPERLAV